MKLFPCIMDQLNKIVFKMNNISLFILSCFGKAVCIHMDTVKTNLMDGFSVL